MISKRHNIEINKLDTLIVGPDLKLWCPAEEKEEFILWKGNSGHFVKDIGFGLKVAKKLDKYKFKFMGHPKPYEHYSHIDEAKRAKIYFSTSLSETKGMALAEQWAAGVPSVTHPKIYLHGKNYSTGIITSRSVEDYCEAIEEIMENNRLYARLCVGARTFAEEELCPLKMSRKYFGILNDVC